VPWLYSQLPRAVETKRQGCALLPETTDEEEKSLIDSIGGKDALSGRLTQIFTLPRKVCLLLWLPLLAKHVEVENILGVTGQG
jgi:hypothetical protein